jgi:fatty aldehyde-generating acyl-ACP reductase
VDFGFDYGLPAGMTYGCIAETMALTFEGLYEDVSLGKDLPLAQIRRVAAIATKHGFALTALRSYEHKLDDVVIQKVKAQVYAGGIG